MRAEPWMDKTPEQARFEERAAKRAYVIGQLLSLWPEISAETREFLLQEQARCNRVANQAAA